MRNDQVLFTDKRRFRIAKKLFSFSRLLATGMINRNICNIYVSQTDSLTMRKMPRLEPWEYSSFRRLPVSTDSNYSPSNKDLLGKIYERTVAMIHLAGTNAEMVRCDFEAGTKAEDIQALTERLQRLARKKGSRVHYVIQAELRPGDTENHWHAAIWYDASVMDFPAQVNGAWKKIGADKKIIWRRNRDLPFKFQIGKSQVELKRAFFAASYLCKSSTPPRTCPKHKARIISRLHLLPDRTPEFQGETRLIPPAMTARSFRTIHLNNVPEFQGKE